MKHVLVTGANGFIGSHLVERLVKQKVHVKCLIRKVSDIRWLNGLDIEYIYGDLSDTESLERAVKNVDTVFHLAGRTKAKSEECFYRTNSAGTLNLLKAVARSNPKIKRFVYVSSMAAAGPATKERPIKESDPCVPMSSYGASKLAAEKAVLAFSLKIPVTIVRPSAVFGPRDRDVLEIFKFINRGFSPKLGFVRRFYSLIYVDDLVAGIILSAQKKEAAGEIFFLSSYQKVSLDEFNKKAARILGKKTVPLFFPITLAFVISIFTELAAFIKGKETIINRQKVLEMRQRYWICDNSKAKDILGFKPSVSLEEAIRYTTEWYKKEKWL